MDQNWLDISVFIVIATFLFIGLTSGFVFSLFRLIAMTISMGLAGIFYNKLTPYLFDTFIEEIIGNLIYDGFRSDPAINLAQRNLDIDGVHNGIYNMLKLPPQVAERVLIKPASLDVVSRTSLFEDLDIIMFFSKNCTRMVLSIFCIIALYIVIRIMISLLKIFLDELAALKIFRIFNYTLAPIFGILEGFSVVYITLSVVVLINMVVQQEPVYQIIANSNLARSLYENNLFMNFTLSKL